MSFSTAQKSDIFSQPLKSNCCKKAMLYGIMAPKAELCDGRILISLDSKTTADL